MRRLVDLVNELLYPDPENHIAYRFGRRQAARLIRAGEGVARLAPPDDTAWGRSRPTRGARSTRIQVEPLPAARLEADEVRVAIEAVGLNFRDVFISIGLVEDSLGGEFCGRVLETGAGVSSVAPGDRVVWHGVPRVRNRDRDPGRPDRAGTPPEFSVSELATMPTAFVSAALSFDMSGLEAGERVLIHAGAGGVGLAAIQLAQAAGG